MAIRNMPLETARTAITSVLADQRKDLWTLNHTIWANPELAYEEFVAHDTLSTLLEQKGFAVTRSAYGLDTSFEAVWPSSTETDSPMVTFCAEYDALPTIGHACGHNLISTASVAAFLTLTALLEKEKVAGRVRLLGTPAEEGGGGKIRLIDTGGLRPFSKDRPEIALMVHPVSYGSFQLHEQLPPSTRILAGFRCIADEHLAMEFFGHAAHAGGEPWLGRNALDAAVTAYSAIGQLRQHIRSDERVNTIISHGGDAPGVIPAFASLACGIRAPNKEALEKLSARVHACAAGAAQTAGCEVKVKRTDPAYLDLQVIEALSTVFAEEAVEAEHGNIDAVVAHTHVQRTIATDMGNVSHVMPAFHGIFGIPSANDASCHDPRFTDASGTEESFERALVCAQSMTMLGWRFISDPSLTATISDQFLRLADGSR